MKAKASKGKKAQRKKTYTLEELTEMNRLMERIARGMGAIEQHLNCVPDKAEGKRIESVANAMGYIKLNKDKIPDLSDDLEYIVDNAPLIDTIVKNLDQVPNEDEGARIAAIARDVRYIVENLDKIPNEDKAEEIAKTARDVIVAAKA